MSAVITNAGRAIETNLVSGLGGTAPNYMALGSGTTAAAATDTTLGTEYTTGTWSAYARVHVTPTRTTTSVTNDTISWVGTFTAPASETVGECGLLDALTTGNLAIHGVFASTSGLSNGDSITVTITEQYT